MQKHTPHRIIQNQVDLILFEEGVFSPVNWLLREGSLDYDDYQNWRNGKSEYLEDNFKASPAQIMATLEMIKDYLISQQIEPINQTYSSTNGQTLNICRSREKELIFTTIYEPSDKRIQMDLFFDSVPICTENNLIEAIISHREDDTSDLLLKLQKLNQEKYIQFKRLLTFKKTITKSSETCDEKIKSLQTITPLAFEVFGRFTPDFLTPFWHKLSIEIADQCFDAESPDYHLSFTAFKGFQWQQVLSSIEREKDWTQQEILIFRYAEACYKLNKEHDGIANWFRLFITFPETAELLIKNSCNRVMFSDWKNFCELDPELELFLFPAWVVMKNPALANNTVISDINSHESLQLIKSLVCNVENEINETTIHIRTKLKHNYPALFDQYMNNRAM